MMRSWRHLEWLLLVWRTNRGSGVVLLGLALPQQEQHNQGDDYDDDDDDNNGDDGTHTEALLLLLAIAGLALALALFQAKGVVAGEQHVRQARRRAGWE